MKAIKSTSKKIDLKVKRLLTFGITAFGIAFLLGFMSDFLENYIMQHGGQAQSVGHEIGVNFGGRYHSHILYLSAIQIKIHYTLLSVMILGMLGFIISFSAVIYYTTIYIGDDLSD